MGAKPKAMEDIRSVIRLHQDGFSNYAIQEHTGISLPTIRKYLNRLKEVDYTLEALLALDNKTLSEICFPEKERSATNVRLPQLLAHFKTAETELKRTGVTKQLLWIEYKEQYPDGYNYSQYCFHFSEYLKNKEVVMYLEHRAGEKIMMDFAGKKLCYTDPSSGEVIECQVFVSVLPHSGLIYCCAVHSQTTGDFIACLNQMLHYYEGVTLTILCDNLKTAAHSSFQIGTGIYRSMPPAIGTLFYNLLRHPALSSPGQGHGGTGRSDLLHPYLCPAAW